MGMSRKRTVGAVCFSEQWGERELSFEEVLLDERLVQGDIWVSRKALRKVGGINYRLEAKRDYELLVRIAREYAILQLNQEIKTEYLTETGNKEEEAWLHLKSKMADDGENAETIAILKTDCYLIGRYKGELLSLGCFDDAVMEIASVGDDKIVQYLEGMVAGTEEYWDIFDCTQPILIYMGNDVCYSILDTFAVCLGEALGEFGQCVEYFDCSRQNTEELADYTKRRFKAVIGIQTYMFSVKWKNGEFAHNRIDAPKYQFIFDHPVELKEHLKMVPHRLCVLTLDNNYVNFVNDYYGDSVRFLPPAGSEMPDINKERNFDLSFLGSYVGGLIEKLWNLRKCDRNRCYFVNRYILYMRHNLNGTAEQALRKTLGHYRITSTKEEFVEIMYREAWVHLLLAHYYRNKVVETLLKAGIVLHVFGETWKKSPLYGCPMLICHEAVIGERALEVYACSKLSLNVMKWHKGGFTERIANTMLQKSVAVTDRTDYLEENFVDGEDILMFDLNHLEDLPGRIKELLGDEKRRKQIAENGYRKALKNHTWNNRAAEILELIEEDRGLPD